MFQTVLCFHILDVKVLGQNISKVGQKMILNYTKTLCAKYFETKVHKGLNYIKFFTNTFFISKWYKIFELYQVFMLMHIQ